MNRYVRSKQFWKSHNPWSCFDHGMKGGFIVVIDRSEEYQAVTVTNDAERVVEWLLERYGNHRIIYKDTDSHWDELAHDGTQFKGFKFMPRCFTLDEETP